MGQLMNQLKSSTVLCFYLELFQPRLLQQAYLFSNTKISVNQQNHTLSSGPPSSPFQSKVAGKVKRFK